MTSAERDQDKASKGSVRGCVQKAVQSEKFKHSNLSNHQSNHLRLPKETKPPLGSRERKIPVPCIPARHGEFLFFFFYPSFMSQLQELEHGVPEALIFPQAQAMRLSLR